LLQGIHRLVGSRLGSSGSTELASGFRRLTDKPGCAVKAVVHSGSYPRGNWFAPLRSNQSSGGGNETAEASGAEGRHDARFIRGDILHHATLMAHSSSIISRRFLARAIGRPGVENQMHRACPVTCACHRQALPAGYCGAVSLAFDYPRSKRSARILYTASHFFRRQRLTSSACSVPSPPTPVCIQCTSAQRLT